MNEAIVYTRWGSWNFGFEHSLVVGKTTGEPYLERWYVMLLGFTIRLHKFYRGDDDRALHDHPWNFITFPFSGYYERIEMNYARPQDSTRLVRYVRPWRFHFRPATFRHMVLGLHSRYFYPRGTSDAPTPLFDTPWPFWTFVITTGKKRTWGFWPNGKFVNWREF